MVEDLSVSQLGQVVERRRTGELPAHVQKALKICCSFAADSATPVSVIRRAGLGQDSVCQYDLLQKCL